MSTPFKLKGYTYPGTSPLTKKNRQWYVDNYETHKDKEGFQAAMDKAFEGETTIEGKVTTTRKPQ